MKEDYKKMQAEISKCGKTVSVSQSEYWAHMKTALDHGPGSLQSRFAAASKEYRLKLGLKEA